MLWRLRASKISMRAHAPFPTLLAIAGLLLACISLPASLFARTPANQHDKHPKATHPKAAGRPRSNVHKARRQKKHVSLPVPSHPVPPVELASASDTATTDRVHAWLRSQQTAAPATPNAAPLMESAATTPPAADPAPDPAILPTLYNRRGRLIVPPPLKGSHQILLRQNLIADSDGLERVHDDADLDHMRAAGILVPVPADNSLRIDDRLPANRRFCRPWTALFLDTLARQHFARFQTPLQVNSAVRTVEFQQRLLHSNGNAAPAEGDTASPHLTGQAVDIAKHGLTLAEIAWLRAYLLPLVQQGKLDVEEEFQQSCFHISVYKKYLPQAPARRVIATTHREGMSSLGLTLR
jgi:hypothetical protein